MAKYHDLTGQKFGRLTVIEYVGRDRQRFALWKCKCDCGKFTVTRGSSLRNGSSKSCGCLRLENALKACTTHGLSGGRKNISRIYRIWRNMKSRCYNPNTPKYKNHGGRGIIVCAEWHKFEPFYRWAMANGYADNLTLERIDNDGNYEPSNCRWATYEEQALNTRQNCIIIYQGKVKTLKEWAELRNIKYSTLRARLFQYKWTIENALETPVRERMVKK